MSAAEQPTDIYARFAAAWAARDIEALLSCVTDDVVYGASVGHEPGTTYRGKAAVADGFRAMMAHDHGSVLTPGRTVFVGDLGFAEWTYRGPAGEVRGIDVLVFRDGLLAVKDAYRKCRA